MASALHLAQVPVKLNLGCSDAHLSGFLNVDRCAPADVIADLAENRWPWETSSVAEIKAWDIFEHLPSKMISMNEAHRILKPGGVLDLVVPTTDGRGAFQDPTHQTFWTPNDLFYFSSFYAEWRRFHVAYGITANFELKMSEHKEYPDKVWKLRALLKAVK
jgi:SAM-dependent methyltransferase